MRSRRVSPALAVAAACFLLHCLTNGRYGFHRDELATLDDAAHLAWGYVAYPPLTPFLARVAVELFGATTVAVRLFAALAQSLVVLLTGLIAREIGGSPRAEGIAAFAVLVSPVSMSAGHLFQYVSFDFLWSVLLVYFVVRLLNSNDPRWWIAAGGAAGLGLMTRYTIAWLIAGLTVGFLLTPARRHLRSWWLAGGMALALPLVLPNLMWQASHHFISLEFLRSIHARDVRIGRTDGFLWKQLLVPAHPFTIPLWIAGLYFYFREPEGQRYRALGWTFAAALILFAAVRARDYYSAPLYPMLLAGGAVLSVRWARWARGLTYAGLAAALAMGVALILPVAPIGSRWYQASSNVNGDLREEIGWRDLVKTVAEIRDTLPAGERATAGILTGNYGEAGAIDLYGGPYGLPKALSGANSFWLRGYGDTPPHPLIVVGLSPKFAQANFTTCESKGSISNRFGVANEETEFDKYLWVCRGLRDPWPEFWKKIKAWE
jgi:Dolichyl-phosphate-mannose-protein mannosyltransferase